MLSCEVSCHYFDAVSLGEQIPAWGDEQRDGAGTQDRGSWLVTLVSSVASTMAVMGARTVAVKNGAITISARTPPR